MDEVELYAVLPGLGLQRFRLELSAVIHRDRSGCMMATDPSAERFGDRLTGLPKTWLYQHRFATPLIDNRQNPNGSPIEQLIMHKIHAQTLSRTLRTWRNAPMQAHVLASAHSHPKLQAVQAIQPMYAFVIDSLRGEASHGSVCNRIEDAPLQSP